MKGHLFSKVGVVNIFGHAVNDELQSSLVSLDEPKVFYILPLVVQSWYFLALHSILRF